MRPITGKLKEISTLKGSDLNEITGMRRRIKAKYEGNE